MNIAADLCIYTNHNFVINILDTSDIENIKLHEKVVTKKYGQESHEETIKKSLVENN